MIVQSVPEGVRPLSLEEAQQESFNILRRFDAFCKKHHLRYSLAGGSLLGAVRHQGFIPWDDDIDVMMARPEYEKLRMLSNEIQDETGFMLRGYPDLDSEEPPFLMLVNPAIRRKPFYRATSINYGIDILPVDGLPEDDAEVARIYRNGPRYRRIMVSAQSDISRGKTGLTRAMKSALKRIDRVFHLSHRMERKLIDMAKRYNYEDSKYVGIITWGIYGPGERMLKEPFEQPAEVTFEGETYPAIGCWDAYLSGLYGDYMQLPPESEREAHNMFVWREEAVGELKAKKEDEGRA